MMIERGARRSGVFLGIALAAVLSACGGSEGIVEPDPVTLQLLGAGFPLYGQLDAVARRW